MKNFFISLMILFLGLLSGTFALAQTPSTGAVVADVLLFRPLGCLGIIAGTAGVIISWPVTIFFNRTHEVIEILIMQPYRYTFERPLGKMELVTEKKES